MSTFGGKIPAFPSISVDNFEGENVRDSKFFFLSHCHTDHMKGLWNRRLNGPLFLSPISEVFVNTQFPLVETRTLRIGDPVQLEVDEGLVVTAFPAYHCPGSIMMVFQNKRGTVLYTGDFRFQLPELQKLTSLKSFKFDEIYVDSTFFSEEYEDFPTQQQSMDEVCELVREWLGISPLNRCVIKQSANIGYELLYIELHKRLGERVWVRDFEFQKYRSIPEIDEAVTDDRSARIEAGFSVPRTTGMHVRCIRVSALKWRNWCRDSPIKENDYSVCYSNHSSHKEIREFLTWLRPRRVFLNVVPAEETDKAEQKRKKMAELLRNVMRGFAVDEAAVGCEKSDVLRTNFSGHRRELERQLQLTPVKKPKVTQD